MVKIQEYDHFSPKFEFLAIFNQFYPPSNMIYGHILNWFALVNALVQSERKNNKKFGIDEILKIKFGFGDSRRKSSIFLKSLSCIHIIILASIFILLSNGLNQCVQGTELVHLMTLPHI